MPVLPNPFYAIPRVNNSVQHILINTHRCEVEHVIVSHFLNIINVTWFSTIYNVLLYVVDFWYKDIDTQKSVVSGFLQVFNCES